MKQAHISQQTLRRILGFARPYRGRIAVFLLFVILDAGLGAVLPLLYKAIIDTGIARHDLRLVIWLALACAVLALADAAVNVGQAWFSARIGQGLILDLRVKVFNHVQQMPLAFFSRTQTGALVQRLNGDVQGAQQAFTSTLSNVVSNVLTVAFVLAAMFSMSWQITLVSLVLVPLIILPFKWVGSKLAAITTEQYDLNAQMSQTMTEHFNVAGAQLVKNYGQPEAETAAFSQTAGKVRDISITSSMYASVFRVTLLLIASIASAIVYGLGGGFAIQGWLTVGVIVALTSYIARLYAPLTALSNVQVDIMSTLVSFDRIFEVLDLKPMVQDRPDAIDLRVRLAEGGQDGPTGSAEQTDLTEQTETDSAAQTGSTEQTGSAAQADQPEQTEQTRQPGQTEQTGQTTGVTTETGAGAATASAVPPVTTTAPGTDTTSASAARPATSPASADISLSHVSFRYPSADEVSLASLEAVSRLSATVSGDTLTDVSFEVPAGSLTALVGPSGAGKTTISQLISRMYDVTAGSIRIGGRDLRDISQRSLHDALGVVTQDAHLFHSSLRSNLLFAKPQASEEELRLALERAQAAFALRLPDGLDTVVGDRGYRLSGGERQRIAIARLLLKAPAIVILDEATAHLDSESEAEVQLALDEALVGRTSLVIAHRLSTIRHADNIVVLDHGRVVEQGTHSQLIGQAGLYAELYHIQFAVLGD